MMATFLCIFLSIVVIVVMECPTTILGDKIDIGVCYGMVADNLPPATEVISLYKQYNIGKIRLFDPNPSALQALRGSNLDVTLGVRNEDITNIASSIDAAKSWFTTNVQPYVNDVNFEYISVGNEYPIPGEIASNTALAMKNIQAVLSDNNLNGIIVTTSVAISVLANSFPPSATVFSAATQAVLVDIIHFLAIKGSPLMVNVYPYYAYAPDPTRLRLDYVLFTAKEAVVVDGNLSYYNLFDAMVDSFYWAMEKQGVDNVGVVVSESGWPSSENGNITTTTIASTYNNNFKQHILSKVGTPKRPGKPIEGFIFAMFNENLKTAGIEQHFGLFYPNKQPVYPVF